MQSLRAVHAGTGYQYLLRSVATNDANPGDSGPKPPSLSEYYDAKGTPPGRWLGTGLEQLQSATAVSGATVDEKQMAALYGEGLHPDADVRMQNGESLADVKIGRSFPVYSGGRSVLADIAKAEKAFKLTENRLPTEDERSDIAESIGRRHYLRNHNDSHVSGEDVIAWVNEQRDQVKQAVAGFDLTFSPTKSVSVLWALSDQKTASTIAAIHHEAVAETMRWVEDNAIYTRRGTNGLEQIKTKGIMASEFTHFDTRDGDPDLHSHVLLSNKVTGTDGKWRSLDGLPLFQMNQAISARYDSTLQDLLSRRMGLDFEPVVREFGKEPVWEVAGVDETLVDGFSKRRTRARPVYDRLVREHTAKHGPRISKRQSHALWQQAILETRNAKKPAQSLSELRDNWRNEALSMVGQDAVSTIAERAAGQATRPQFSHEDDTAALASAAVSNVIDKRAYFRDSHLDTAVSVLLKGYRFDSDAERAAAHAAVFTHAKRDEVVTLTPPERLRLPKALLSERGEGIDRRANTVKHTTASVLAAERDVLNAATTPTAVFARAKTVTKTLRQFEKANGLSLNEGQERLARHLLESGTLVASGVGPAGTGKTASMKVVVDAWKRDRRQVIPLSTSQSAAQLLGEEVGERGRTIDSLAWTWRGRNENKPARDLSALPVRITPGTMLLVDEAGMATTENLAALTEIAREAGAVVRLVGDPLQLDSVTTGGLFRDLARVPGTPVLDEVMRMRGDTDQAKATLKLRVGDASGLDVHNERGWITGGARADMLRDAARGYLADRAAGKNSLVIASRNADCTALNTLIRDEYIAAGHVDSSRELAVASGEHISVGDTIIARDNQLFFDAKNRPQGRVTNGDLFTVTAIGDDGSLRVHKQGGVGERDMTLPGDYVNVHVHLGYSATVHRAQGATVDTCHAVADTAMDRAALYVAMTRAKTENRVYAVTEFDPDPWAEDAHMHSAGNEWPAEPAEFLGALLAHDRSQRSATATWHDEVDAATSRERVTELYRHGADLAATQFTDATLPHFIDQLPAEFAADLDPDSEGYTTIAAAWRDSVLAGVDPRRNWAAVSHGLEAADDVPSLVNWRLRQHFRADRGRALPHPAPAVTGADPDLTSWLTATRPALTDTARENTSFDRDPFAIEPGADAPAPSPTGPPKASDVMGAAPARQSPGRSGDSSVAAPPKASDVMGTRTGRTRDAQARGILAVQRIDAQIAEVGTDPAARQELHVRRQALAKNLPEQGQWTQILNAWRGHGTGHPPPPETGPGSGHDQGVER